MATVLVVDDDAGLRDLISLILKMNGHSVVTATNGLEGLMLYSSYHSRLDLVVSDIDMPQMDGIELANRIRAQDASGKILLMSGRPPGDRKLPKNCPFLPKPFLPKDLIAIVQRLVSE